MIAYAALERRFAKIATIREAQSMLGWDAAAVMPAGGAKARGDQLSVLAGLAHSILTAHETSADLDQAERSPPEGGWGRANLGLMRRAFTRATALPADLVEALELAKSRCETVWRVARATDDFRLVAPYLAEVVSLVQEEASALGPALGLTPYDALMDGYQPGIGAADAAAIFTRYEAFLATTLPSVEARQSLHDPAVSLAGHFPAAKQEALCRFLAEKAGLDFTHARLDRSTHPFCGGTPTDIRITTRYDESDPSMALLGVLHETGHALYERGLPSNYARQLVGEAAGMAVHESQSLIIEMQVCRSDVFLAWLGAAMAHAFGGDAPAIDPLQLGRLWRRVERGTIRVNADELTYPAHIILRFRLEQALIGGELDVADLPSAWNEQMRSLLGIVPPDDRTGCLQDIHWYDGAFGYFPSYTIGAMAAAQMMAAARREIAGLDAEFGEGSMASLLSWLGSRVHRHGRHLQFDALMRQSTGSSLDPGCFEAHILQRYLGAD